MESLTDLEEWDPLADDNTNQTVLLDEMKKKEIKISFALTPDTSTYLLS